MPIKIIRQDITRIECDAIVNPTDADYSHSGSTDFAIHKAAGKELYMACAELMPLEVGKAVLTAGYNLPAKFVIHTFGPRWNGGENGEEALLRSCYRESLTIAVANGCQSIAFPLISSGTYGFPKDRVLKIAVDEIKNFIHNYEMLVYIAVYDPDSFSISEKLYKGVSSFIDNLYESERTFSGCFSDSSLKRASIVDTRPHSSAVMDSYASMAEEECDLFSKSSESFTPGKSLEDMLKERDKGFAHTLFSYIDKKGLTDVECYKRANVDKKTFSKIKCNKDYRPGKITVVSFAIALHLDLKETEHLLNTVGLSLSHSSVFDIIIKYFVSTGNYKDIFDVNETLYKFDQATLGV